MTEMEERLMRELMTNKELEATCLQLRNQVLHLQGEVKRARREGAADMQASVAEFTSKRADECAKYHRESLTDTDGYWDHAREEISIMAKRIARGDHLDGPSPLDAIRRVERAKGREEERRDVVVFLRKTEVCYSASLIERAAHLPTGEGEEKEDGK